jgi:uncharacterized membrane protein (DUF441 family)
MFFLFITGNGMTFIDPTLWVLLVFVALGMISHNSAVTIAMLVLLIIRVSPLQQFLPWVEKYGLTIGIVILTVGMMAPIASGKISASAMLSSFASWPSVIAILIGIAVSWLGGRGVTLMTMQPHLVTGLLVGTVIGVALFKGVPVGPLIAAGILSLLVGKA